MKEKTKKQNILWRVLILSALLLCCFCLTSFPFSFWSAVSIDYISAFAAAAAFYAPPLEAAIFAFTAGIFKDITTGSIPGFHAMVYMLLAITVSILVAVLVRRTFLNGLVLSAAFVVGAKFFYYFIYNVLFQKGGRIALFLRGVLPSVLLTVVILPLMLIIVRKIHLWFSNMG